MAYVINSGLNIGVPYNVENYPAAINPAPGGCRHLTGHVDDNGIVTIYATTSTISASGDQGADPNQLVKVQDILDAKTPRVINHFKVIRAAKSGEVFRGVDWAPLESGQDNQN